MLETYVDRDAKETEDRDPCEVYLYDYKDADGKKLPHRMEVRYRDKRYAVLTVAKFVGRAREVSPRTDCRISPPANC